MLPFVTSIECRQNELGRLREQLGAWLEAGRVPPGRAFHAKLVTHEAAKNVITRADPEALVTIRAAIEEDDIVIEVLDTNADPWELDGAEGAEIRGLSLIHGLARHVELVQHAEGTALVMLVARD